MSGEASQPQPLVPGGRAKVCDIIAHLLWQQGVTHVFELPGGMITHLLDSLWRQAKVQIVNVHHEQAAAFAAEGMARITGVPGVALATSGPGATNLLTGIGSCYFDSTPAVFITGQVNRGERKGSRGARQIGFQECDIVAMARPITKASTSVDRPEDVPNLLGGAFALARAGRPGPVLLDIPMDVQRAEIPVPSPSAPEPTGEPLSPRIAEAVGRVLEQLARAQRPVILAGGGVMEGRAWELLRQAVHALRVPLVHSLMAVDALPFDDPCRVGMIGTYGNRWANLSLMQADFVLVLGSRLDVRQTGADTRAFADGRVIVQVDCDPGEVGNRVPVSEAIIADLRPFLKALVEAAGGAAAGPDRPSWLGEIRAMRQRWPDTEELAGLAGINPNILMHALSRASHPAGVLTVDVGQNQMWAAQSVELEGRQRFLTSGGMGSMGFALPAAVGAALATGEAVVAIMGDGGFQISLQELQTIVRNHLPVKIVVLDNGCLGMVRQFQETYFEARFPGTVWGYDCPDIIKVAQAYGLAAGALPTPDTMDEALGWLWADPTAPALLRVLTPASAEVRPKVEFGGTLADMSPPGSG
jgi:acetolactate synthase-1/2/3 large subunit